MTMYPVTFKLMDCFTFLGTWILTVSGEISLYLTLVGHLQLSYMRVKKIWDSGMPLVERKNITQKKEDRWAFVKAARGKWLKLSHHSIQDW